MDFPGAADRSLHSRREFESNVESPEWLFLSQGGIVDAGDPFFFGKTMEGCHIFVKVYWNVNFLEKSNGIWSFLPRPRARIQARPITGFRKLVSTSTPGDEELSVLREIPEHLGQTNIPMHPNAACFFI